MLNVFIENEAGSDIKHHFDEERLVFLRTEQVKAPYAYPYGFIPGTLAPDGDSVDCFVITDRPLTTGDRVDCEPIAMVEQTEGGVVDNNVVAVIPGDPMPDLEEVREAIADCVGRMFAGMPGREVTVGRMLPVEDALAYLEECRRR